MKKLAILATGAALLTLAGCGPKAPKQTETNAAAPVADTMAVNAAENADMGAMADNASNTGDRTIGDRTIGDRTIGDRTNKDRTIGDRTNKDK
jgi:predicted small lipoprotein YifL